jgi:outer membrane protein assembly factor BamD
MSILQNQAQVAAGYRSRTSFLALLACLVVGPALLAACSGTSKDVRQPEGAKKSLDGTDEQIFVESTVEKYYHPNVIMKRGEAFFDRQEFDEALVEYNHFLDLHRNHVLAPYAAFRIGEIHFKRAKTIDRDPDPMQRAITAFERVRKEFSGSRYDGQAAQKLQECHDWLAQMHLFVGQFYYRRGSYLAAAHRFEQIIKSYPDKPVASDALYFLAKAYHDLGADDWARESLVLLAEKYPESEAASNGNSLLAKIGGAQTGPLIAVQSNQATDSNTTQTDGRSTGSVLPDRTSISPPSQLDTLGIPSANALGQAFTSCRLGAWC